MPKKNAQKKKGSATRKEEVKKEMNFDLGTLGVSLGGVLKGLGNLVDIASSLREKGDIHGEKEFTIPVEGKELKGIYGFSIRTAEGGKPVISTFGNKIKKTPKGPVVEEEREPLVDVIPENGGLRIVAELPGVAENEIEVVLKGDVLNIKTNGRNKYAKEVLLSSAVKSETMKKVYNNGILELRLEKR